MNVLRDAADAVAAHLPFRTVDIEHAHLGVGDLRRADEDKAVRADAGVPVADGAGEGARVTRLRLPHAIDVDVVVADAVHFGELHPTTPIALLLPLNRRRWLA